MSDLSFDQPRIKIVVDNTNKQAIDLAKNFKKWEKGNPNLIVVIGGDGTMLHSIKDFGFLELPFLGFNTGHRGFLMNEFKDFDFKNFYFNEYNLPLLNVEIETMESKIYSALAFNDAWVERNGGQTAWIKVETNGVVRIEKLIADGILLSTPAGSTAYAMAMGASPLPLDCKALILVASNVSQPFGFRSCNLNSNTQVKFTNCDTTGKRQIRGFIDGRDQGPIKSMSISASTSFVRLSFIGIDKLAEKLNRIQFQNF